MNPTAIILICSVIFFAVNDPSGNPDRGLKGAISGFHPILLAGNLQEEEGEEDLKYADPVELNASQLPSIENYQPGISIKHPSIPVFSEISGLDPVFLDRPPPPQRLD
jgi:hypothetical protein